MSTSTNNSTLPTNEIINLIKGVFTPSDAKEILLEIIDKKINFHKIKKLNTFEKNHHDPAVFDETRINELRQERKRIESLFADSADSQEKLQIQGTLIIQMQPEK